MIKYEKCNSWAGEFKKLKMDFQTSPAFERQLLDHTTNICESVANYVKHLATSVKDLTSEVMVLEQLGKIHPGHLNQPNGKIQSVQSTCAISITDVLRQLWRVLHPRGIVTLQLLLQQVSLSRPPLAAPGRLGRSERLKPAKILQMKNRWILLPCQSTSWTPRSWRRNKKQSEDMSVSAEQDQRQIDGWFMVRLSCSLFNLFHLWFQKCDWE